MASLSEIETLASQLESHAAAYYTGTPSISDEQYDALRDRLEELDPSHPALAVVGTRTPSESVKVRHMMEMLSLRKATTADELAKWWEKITDTASHAECVARLEKLAGPDAPLVVAVVQPKLDGSSLELQYCGGILVAAVTRGDGIEGEDVMATAVKMANVPHTLDSKWTGAVRGEAVLTKPNWAIVDPEKATNARNVGNGVLRRISDTSQAHLLTFFAYSVHDPAGTLQSECHVQAWLIANNFRPSLSLEVLNLDHLQNTIETLREMRDKLEYDIDGAVIRANLLSIHGELGVSSGRPHAQIAYKWPSATTTTVVTGVTLTVGHTGYIIPTATLKPVPLGGVTVSNALLNNWVEIETLGVAVGDEVEIIRTGEIIPKILRVVKRGADRKPILEPNVCPCCGGAAQRAVNPTGSIGALTVCISNVCPAKSVGKVKRWIKSLDILGIGDDLLEALTASEPGSAYGFQGNNALVKTPADLYRLTVEKLQDVPMGKGRVGVSRATSIVANIKSRTNVTIDQFLGSLGAPYLGKRRVEIVREQAGGKLDKVSDWMNPVNLSTVLPLLLPAMAPAICKWFLDNGAFVNEMFLMVGVSYDVAAKPTPKPVQPFDKPVHSFVLTGKFEVPKATYYQEITAAGHAHEDDISPRTTHLVQADKSSVSNKTKKATAKGIKIIDVRELYDLLNG